MAEAAPVIRAPNRSERGYVYSTVRAFIARRYGDRFVNYDDVIDLVDPILDRCRIALALFHGVFDDFGRPEIHGFVVEDTADHTIEFFHIRKLYRDMESPDLAARVARGLLGDRHEVILRRGPTDEALKAIVAAKYNLAVKPRSV